MLLLFETPAGYSLFKVKDENKLKDIDVRSASFLSLFLLSRGIRRQLERAINDLIVCSVALLSLSLSLSKSSRPIRNENATIVSSLFISHVSVDGGLGQRDVPAQKRVSSGSQICVKADATFILVFFSSLGLCFYTQKNTYIIGVGEIVRHRGFRQENGLDESVREVRKHDGRVSGGGNHG